MKSTKYPTNNDEEVISKIKKGSILFKKTQKMQERYHAENGLKENKNDICENGNSHIKIRTNLTSVKSNNSNHDSSISSKIKSIISKKKSKIKKIQSEKIKIIKTLLKRTLKEQNTSYKLVLKHMKQRRQTPFSKKNDELNRTCKFGKIPISCRTMSPMNYYKNNSIANYRSKQIFQTLNDRNTVFNKNNVQNNLSKSYNNVYDFICNKNKNKEKEKYIFLDNKCTETKKVSCSVIKTEKTIALLEGSKIQPKETINIKEKPITEIIKNKNGTKTHVTKNTFVKITTENKKMMI